MNLLEQLPDSGQCAPNIEPLCARSWRPWSPVRLGTQMAASCRGNRNQCQHRRRRGTAAAAYFHFAPVTNTSTAFCYSIPSLAGHKGTEVAAVGAQVHRRR